MDDDGIAHLGFVRLQADGYPTSLTIEPSGSYTYPTSVARFSDGRMWVTAEVPTYIFGTVLTAYPNNLARLNTNGSFDFSFNLASSLAASPLVFGGVLPLGNDRALVWDSDLQLPSSFRYYRTNADGTLDNTFNPDSSTPFFTKAGPVQQDNVFISAGNSAQATVYSSLSRIYPDGTNDGIYQRAVMQNLGQVVRDNSGSIYNLYVGSYALASLSPDKVLLEYLASDYRYHLVRLKVNGTIDNTFSSATLDSNDFHFESPIIVDPASPFFDPANPYYIQVSAATGTRPMRQAQVLANGKIVIAGQFTSFKGTPARGVVRLLPDGTVDSSFSVGGGAQWTSRTESTYLFPTVEGVQLLQNGNLLVIGDFEAFNGVTASGIALLKSDGSVDSSFRAPVHRIYERSAKASFIPQPDGSLMLSGPYSFSGENIERSLVRLQPNLSLASLSVSRSGSNVIHLQGLGIPNAPNRIEASTDLSPGSFTTLVTIPIDQSGSFQYDDLNPGVRKFYRLVYP